MAVISPRGYNHPLFWGPQRWGPKIRCSEASWIGKLMFLHLFFSSARALDCELFPNILHRIVFNHLTNHQPTVVLNVPPWITWFKQATKMEVSMSSALVPRNIMWWSTSSAVTVNFKVSQGLRTMVIMRLIDVRHTKVMTQQYVPVYACCISSHHHLYGL